jgi:type VI secretion system protein ImpF
LGEWHERQCARFVGPPDGPAPSGQRRGTAAHEHRAAQGQRRARPRSPAETFDLYPEAKKSILNYGLIDFAGYCLSSTEERAHICTSLVDAVVAHEPRLSGVTAALEQEPGSVNRLNFVINGTLELESGAEPVNFNAVLQPSSLHYAISRGARVTRV